MNHLTPEVPETQDTRFCPDGYFPPSKHTVTLHPDGDKTRCLDVKDGRLEVGNTVQL